MKIIALERGKGKTTELIKMSAETKIPIICAYPQIVAERALKIGLDIPQPLTVNQLRLPQYIDIKEIYIDEIDFILEKMVNYDGRQFNIIAGTTTPDNDDVDCDTILLNMQNELAKQYKTMIGQYKYNEGYNILKNIDLIKEITKNKIDRSI